MKSDFNGDGKADVLWQNSSGSRALWLMNGATFGSSIFLPSVAISWKRIYQELAKRRFSFHAQKPCIKSNNNVTLLILFEFAD